MIQEPLKPEDDILVWLALQKALKARFPECRFKLKEDAEGILTVLCHQQGPEAADFAAEVKGIVADFLGGTVLAHTVVSLLSAEAFDVVY